jgi:hypothetical protein
MKRNFEYYGIKGDALGFAFKQFIKKFSSKLIGKIFLIVGAIIAIVLGFLIGLTRIEKD